MFAIERPEWTAPDVYRAVNRVHAYDVDNPEAGGGPVVSLRTVQRVMADIEEAALTTRWTLADGDASDIPLVLDVVRHLVDRRSRSPFPSKGEGELIARFRRAFPDLDSPPAIHVLAVFANRGGDDARHVELWLAYAPWRDDQRALRKAIASGGLDSDIGDFADALDPVLAWTAAVEEERRERS